MPHILIVEDEAAIADTLVFALQGDGHSTEWVSLGQAALERQRQQPADLVILDIGLPDISGFETCRQLRRFSEVPVMFLSARDGEIDRVVGLEIGADDYVVKPFSLDTLRMQIHYREHLLNLTRHEFRLLQCLLEQPERVFSREQLLDAVGVAADVGYERSIDSHIKSLRAKLRQVAPAAEPIQTHRGLGYSYNPAHA